MSIRGCRYGISDAAYAAVPKEVVESLVEDAVTSALERNKDLSGDALIRLYMVLADDGPRFVTTSLIEEGGQHHCYVALWSEMKGRLQAPSPGPARS
jgi:hypothetical protein